MKYRRIRMFFYNHGAALLNLIGLILVVSFAYLLASADCATGGSCQFASSGPADAVLGPRK
jgi:hypothetical protein